MTARQVVTVMAEKRRHPVTKRRVFAGVVLAEVAGLGPQIVGNIAYFSEARAAIEGAKSWATEKGYIVSPSPITGEFIATN